MNAYVFVITIIAIVVTGRIVRHYMTIRHERQQDNPEWRTQIDSLEERIQTLERIVTDKGYDLKREFDRL